MLLKDTIPLLMNSFIARSNIKRKRQSWLRINTFKAGTEKHVLP